MLRCFMKKYIRDWLCLLEWIAHRTHRLPVRASRSTSTRTATSTLATSSFRFRGFTVVFPIWLSFPRLKLPHETFCAQLFCSRKRSSIVRKSATSAQPAVTSQIKSRGRLQLLGSVVFLPDFPPAHSVKVVFLSCPQVKSVRNPEGALMSAEKQNSLIENSD